MKKYRKKTVVVEAEQWFKVTYDRVAGHGYTEKDLPIYHLDVGHFRHPKIKGTSKCCLCGKSFHEHGYINETDCKVCPGDYILKLPPHGEYAPCCSDRFERQYEEVEE